MRLGKLTGECPNFYEVNTTKDMMYMGNKLSLARGLLEEFGKVEDYLVKHSGRLTKAEFRQADMEINYFLGNAVSALDDAIDVLRMIKAKTKAYSEVVSQWL